jgi:hypothetical protein
MLRIERMMRMRELMIVRFRWLREKLFPLEIVLKHPYRV